MLAASSDISIVPPEFIKYFLITLGWLITVGGAAFAAHRRAKRVAGTKDEPVHMAQPVAVNVEGDVVVKQNPEYAHKKEVAKELEGLEQRMEAMARENLRQHQATAAQLNASIQEGAKREGKILTALHEMEQRMTAATLKEMQAIHVRLNPVAEKTEAHATAIKNLEGRCSELWQQITKLWENLTHPKTKRSS